MQHECYMKKEYLASHHLYNNVTLHTTKIISKLDLRCLQMKQR